jgi:hypothetical protein
MFSSAVVKLASGDPAWRHLTALEYHYETQPLPPWTAWYAAHWPAWFQRASAAGVLVIEGLVPLLILAPRRIRFAGAGALLALQILILLTGNYAFFNWLAILLCLLLLDDGVWPRGLRDRFASRGEARPGGAWRTWVARPVLVALLLLSVVPLAGTLGGPPVGRGPLEAAYRAVLPFRLVNHYGLFAVMTTERPEIILEGSDDGRSWKPYEFRYKPGDPSRRPRFVAPLEPRLDWQMWFAALGITGRTPGFSPSASASWRARDRFSTSWREIRSRGLRPGIYGRSSTNIASRTRRLAAPRGRGGGASRGASTARF